MTSRTWRYAISREEIDGNIVFAVREVYIDNDGETDVLSWTENPVSPFGETWTEVADDVSIMSRVVGSYVLDLTLDPPRLVHPREVR